MSLGYNVKMFIDGLSKPVPLNWKDITITAQRAENTNNLLLDISEFILVDSAKDAVVKYHRSGRSFKGLNAALEFSDNKETIRFDGFLDLTQNYREIGPFIKGSNNPRAVNVKFVDRSGIDKFSNYIKGTTYGFLESKKVFTDKDYTDLRFVIEKEANALEVALLILAIYTLAEKTIALIKELANNIATLLGISSAGATGPAAGVIYQIAVIVIQAIYAALLISLLIKLVFDLVSLVISPVYTNKVQSLFSLLSKAFAYKGYEFETNLEILKDIYYMASKPYDNSENLFIDFNPLPATIDKGLPNTQDSGFIISEMLEIARKLVNGRVSVIDNKVILRNTEDPFWFQNAKYKQKDIGGQVIDRTYNYEDMVGTQTLEFITDIADSFTIRNFTGTTVEVKTTVKGSDPSEDLIKGLNREIINCALINRKDKLNNLEKVVEGLADTADKLAKQIGKKGKFKELVGNRVGAAKIGGPSPQVPKLIYLKDGVIPENHRQILGADALYTKYHTLSKSFVQNDSNAQESIHENVQNVPISISELKDLVKNTKFINYKSESSEMYTVTLNGANNTSTQTWREKHIYATGLEETKFVA